MGFRLAAGHIILLFLLTGIAGAGEKRTLRYGYIDDPGSALTVLAQSKGYLKGERVQLSKYSTGMEVMSALASGEIDVAAAHLGDALRVIASDGRFRIVSGGGAPENEGLLKEIDASVPSDAGSREVVTVMGPNIEKKRAIRIVSALIKSHLTLQHDGSRLWKVVRNITPPSSPAGYRFDPNPDFYRFQAVWKDLGLQREEMRRDYLSSHVDEEAYCDALDQVADTGNPKDKVLQDLIRKANCIPNCCPTNKGKLAKFKGGIQQ